MGAHIPVPRLFFTGVYHNRSWEAAAGVVLTLACASGVLGFVPATDDTIRLPRVQLVGYNVGGG